MIRRRKPPDPTTPAIIRNSAAAAGMACLQLARAGISPALGLLSVPPRRRRFRLHPRCRLQGGDADSRGEEPPESLFMKELKRRGMNKTSLLDDGGRGVQGLEEELEGETGGRSATNAKLKGAVSTEYEDQGHLFNQRERSMALNSEGLEGLIPRAKALLTIGGTFFLGFWPLIMIIIALFATLYFYFGPSFVHDAAASRLPPTPPPYIDPYALLQDERLSQTSGGLN